MLPTDTQKNTAFAYAKLHGVTSPEDYALALGRRLLEATPGGEAAQVRVEQYAWDRLPSRPSTPLRPPRRRGTHRASSTVGREATHVLSGLQDLVLLKSTGSEFKGFLVDEFTTLAEADDRILATSLVAAGGTTRRDGGLERVVRRGARRAAVDLRHDVLAARCRRRST